MQKIDLLLGTRNKAKLAHYGEIFSDLAEVISPGNLGIPELNVEETLDDAYINAGMKAVAYQPFAGESWVMGEDTSLEIPLFGNLPGPAVRRWNGELPDTISDALWVESFRSRIEKAAGRNPVPCLKIHHYAIISPDSEIHRIETSLEASIRLRDMPKDFEYQGGPLSHFLFLESKQKYESELTIEDRQKLFADLRNRLKQIAGKPEAT